MAVLGEADRAEIWAEFMRELSNIGAPAEVTSFTKAELRAAVDAADQWAQDNAASFNTALPVAFRTKATSAQKARLLARVVERRFVRGV